MRRYGPSKSRIVFYRIDGPFRKDPEPLLKRAVEQKIITQYDDGRGALVWFEGPPGRAMRELRKLVEDCK